MKICLIPARRESKRLKNKNIKIFFGKPLIAYSILTAIKSNLFDEICVSTDSLKIANIAKKYGAKIPFLRPKKFSNDHAGDLDVINHYLKFANSNKMKIDLLCYLYPTSPLVKVSTLKKCMKLLIKSKVSKVITISKFSYPIERSLKKNNLGNIVPNDKKFFKKRSQDLRTYYQDAAQCYWYNLKNNNLKNQSWSKTSALELKQSEIQDIDTLEDFKMAELLYKFNYLKK